MNIEQGVIVAILAHAAATVWWSSRINTTMGFVKDEIVRLNKELEKRDEVFKAVWRRIDELREKVDMTGGS